MCIFLFGTIHDSSFVCTNLYDVTEYSVIVVYVVIVCVVIVQSVLFKMSMSCFLVVDCI